MRINDSEYYRRRSASERAMAQAASDPRVAAIHHQLADRYEALVRAGKRPTLRVVTDRATEAA